MTTKADFKKKLEKLKELSTTPGREEDKKRTFTALMPMYPKGVSGLPHCIARSALFAPVRRGRRQYKRQELIASRGDVSISYTGEQLDMADQDVFLLAAKTAEERFAGEVCFFERGEFLQDIGRKSDGKSAYYWLDKSFKRLMGGFITVKTTLKKRKIEISTQILQKYGIDNESGRFFVQFTPEASKLFQAYGHIDMVKRRLIRHDFTKWLQSYVSSHERGQHFVTAEQLHSWSKSEMILKEWKYKKLKPALKELETLGIIKAMEINGNVIQWIRI